MDLEFESDFNNLLSFLKELEFQESVILFRDLNLKLKNDLENKDEDNKLENTLKVSMNIIVYGKIKLKKE